MLHTYYLSVLIVATWINFYKNIIKILFIFLIINILDIIKSTYIYISFFAFQQDLCQQVSFVSVLNCLLFSFYSLLLMCFDMPLSFFIYLCNRQNKNGNKELVSDCNVAKSFWKHLDIEFNCVF